MVQVNVTGGQLEKAEIDAYLARAKEKYPDKVISSMDHLAIQ